MGILSRLFGGASAADRVGIRLDDPDPWEVTGTRDVERFLRALPRLTPAGAFVYFEGTGEPHVAEYLRSISVPAPVHVACGNDGTSIVLEWHDAFGTDPMLLSSRFTEGEVRSFAAALGTAYERASVR